MDRVARLQSAPRWIATYTGARIVPGYARWFGVDRHCAILELRMLGVVVPESEVQAAAHALEAAQTRTARARARAAERERACDGGELDDVHEDDTWRGYLLDLDYDLDEQLRTGGTNLASASWRTSSSTSPTP